MRNGPEKVRTALGLIMVVLLIFMTNRMDKKHFEEVQDSIVSIYEDRVVAQDYLFDMSRIFHEKRLKLAMGEEVSELTGQELDELLLKYEGTNLTKKEAAVLGRMKELIEDLRKRDFTNDIEQGTSAEKLLDRIDEYLAELSDIQVKESRGMKIRAQKSLDSNLLISNIEVFLIVVVGIILQFVLFYAGRKKTPKASS